MKSRRRHRGHLLIEFSVAAAVATAAVAGTMATYFSTAKTGREIEVLTQAVSDATAFAAYETNLHQMGGPNSGYGTNGDLASDYVFWINNNYPTLPNGITTQQSSSFVTLAVGGGTVSSGGLEVGNLGAAYGYQTTPQPGTFVWSATDAAASPMAMTLVYAHAQAFVGLGALQSTTLAVPSADASTAAEAVEIFVSEDPGTGIVTVSPMYNFGTVATATVSPMTAAVDMTAIFTGGAAGFSQGTTAGSATLPVAGGY